MMSNNYNEMKLSLQKQREALLASIKENEQDINKIATLQHQLDNLNYIIELTEMNHYHRGN